MPPPWNFNMDECPKGQLSPYTKRGKGEYPHTEVGVRFEPAQVILASKCGKVTRSYWVPEEDRWCFFSTGEHPVAWMLWPAHPGIKEAE